MQPASYTPVPPASYTPVPPAYTPVPSAVPPGMYMPAPQAVPPSTIPPNPANIPPGAPPPAAQLWGQKYPSIAAGILAVIEGILTLGIIGCEIGSVLIDMVTATIYVGFWAGLFLMIAWISQAGSACCCHGRGCATYTLTMQCISMVFAGCVIGFDAFYLVNPSTCFFPDATCRGGTSRGVFYTDYNFNYVKLSLIKAQLSAGAVVFVLNFVYVMIYAITSIRFHQAQISPQVFPQVQPYSMLPTGPDGMILAPPMANVRAHRATSPLYHRPALMVDHGDGRVNDLLCPTCSTMMAVSVKKRPPQ